MRLDLPPGYTDRTDLKQAVATMRGIDGRPGAIANMTDLEWFRYRTARRLYEDAWRASIDRTRADYHRALDALHIL